jgi:hypothetical protein
MLDFARCMRQHGVDMPDPKFEGGRVTMRQRGDNISPERAHAAEKACKHFQDAIKPPTLTDAEKAEFKQRALAQARCMRKHGIDVPDPVFDEDGGARMEIRKGDGIRPDDPKFRAAERACMPDEDRP